MTKNFIINLLVRTIWISIGALLISIFYNNTIAWNFNLPIIGFWDFFICFWGLRFAKCAIWNVISEDP